MMAALLRYSLVKVKDETVFIHRLVQAVLRERLGQEGRTKWANLAVKLIDQVFVFEEADRSTWATAERLLPHAEIAASHGSSSEVAAELKSLLLRAGRCLDNRALHDRAQALKHSAQALFDHAALGIAVVRDDGRVIQANQALVTMLGFSEAELARQNLADLTHPDDRLADAQAAHRLLAGEVDSYSRENRYRRSDGTWFWGRLTASVTPGEDDSRFRAVMIADIDNHKRAEANLSLFRKVMDASQEAIAIMSPGGHILYANSALHRLFGVDAESARGAHYREYFPPASRENLDQAIAHTLARGESREGVIDAQHMSGQVFPIWQRTGALRDESGRLQFIFAFMHDHTEQQLFENELISAKEAAEEANAAKTHFLAAASHDLRQPMQALSMFVSVLAAQSMDTKQAALVSRIQDCQIALEGLLNGLLDISKLEAGLVVPQMGEFSADALMDRLGAEFEPLCAAAGLSFKHLPCKAVVHSDPSLLERILRNLLNNAIRYTPKGRIVFGCRRRGNRLRIEVWDTGIGIPQGELRNIFREFHQVGNPQRDRHQGLGLGLAIVRRLADLLNHEFGVRSEEGRGSVFSVQVPMTSSRPQLSSNPRKPSGPTAAATILVIEDDADVLEGLCLILSSWGHSVIGATSGEAAVQQMLMSSRTPDLVIADYRLQDGETGGQVVIHLWTRLGQDVPAIILSDETSAERLRQVHALGFPVLHKPVHANVLKGAIDEALAG
jgi:PAS domain S-box-containing protein